MQVTDSKSSGPTCASNLSLARGVACFGKGMTSWSTYFPCRTDFTCCNKEHSYGNDNHHDIGLAFNDKVGTCDCKSLTHVA